ncbi:unnamed protein product, partial [Hymenolepis diminuta]
LPFSITAPLHIKAHLRSRSRVLTQVTHIKLSLLARHNNHAPLSISVIRFKPVVASLNTIWSNQLLVFCSTIIVSSYSNSYELVTAIALVIR